MERYLIIISLLISYTYNMREFTYLTQIHDSYLPNVYSCNNDHTYYISTYCMYFLFVIRPIEFVSKLKFPEI